MRLHRNCASQVPLELAGTVEQTRGRSTPIVFTGVADAVHQGQVYELKFVSELSYVMSLQLALYLVVGGFDSGVLWNTRTDERWSVQVPDRERYLHAVVRWVTKQYRAYAK
ncbi:hypothetical protein [Arthrobacter sp. efr-133-TYG-118]|uniref:hypothetical protein n=1 Tax=Arthrobacter sp. efr-133-TYG-118 TaxID=3040279 RepID=UPI00254CC3FB|nr:hypothetical protein [Arthrobacter sp. efr-133-TYG-118]